MADAEQMAEDLREQIRRMLAHGDTPHAIVASPVVLSRLLPDWGSVASLPRGGGGSGWHLWGLPIWRSWEIGGPTVISKALFDVMVERHSVSLGGEPTPYLF